jgi:hypothetical protein
LSAQNTVLLRQVKDSNDNQYTNQQKYVYEAQQLPLLESIKTGLYVVYALCYLGMLVYMSSKGSSMNTLIVVGIVFALYPFVVQYFIFYIRMFFTFLSSLYGFLTYKDVYQSDLKDTKTTP